MLKLNDHFVRDFVVTEQVYSHFVEAFADRNSLHMDNAYAKNHGYEAKVMHGNILGGFLSYFVGEGLPVSNTIILEQSIRFRSAFYLNDTLTLSATLVELYESVSAYIFKFSFTRNKKTIASGRLQIGLLA